MPAWMRSMEDEPASGEDHRPKAGADRNGQEHSASREEIDLFFAEVRGGIVAAACGVRVGHGLAVIYGLCGVHERTIVHVRAGRSRDGCKVQ